MAEPTTLTQTLARFFAPEIAAWHGDAPLGRVFWGYGVGVSWMLVALYATVLEQGQIWAEQALLPVCAGYTLWILVSIWRCSLAGPPTAWTVLARFLTIAWAGNVALILLFRQMDVLLLIVAG